MTGFELAKRRVEAGQRLRFYQDFYGRQWVQISGGWRTLWLKRKIRLSDLEISALKSIIAHRRKSAHGKVSAILSEAKTA